MLNLKKHYNLYKNNYNNQNNFQNNFLFAILILISLGGFLFFLIETKLIFNTLLIFLLSLIIVYPYRKSAKILTSYIILFGIIFLFWLFQNLGTTIIPFMLSLIVGYLLDPVLSKLERLGIKRWVSSTLAILVFIGLITTLSIYLFPQLLEQASSIIKQINIYVEDVKRFSTSEDTTDVLKKIGLSKYTLKELFDNELMPKIQDISKSLFNFIITLLSGLSNVTTQLINVILLPILTFYFLKDFSNIKNKIKTILKTENKTLYKYIYKLNSVIRIYVGWQIIASLIIGIFGGIFLVVFDVPYAILLACVATLLSPIPYFGIIITIAIGVLTSLIANDGNFFYNFGIISLVLCLITFINAYILEPNVAGNKIGLHPILMILSVFIFNSMFGILGMLIAVPVTAVVVTFLKDMIEYYQSTKRK
ncbi:MAG: AI-2E family transporter [Bacteroidetes bacterium]|nr:AI-2E family transporter [Bacteroidota bacterium]